MIELYRWLGDLNGINTLSLFDVNHHDYFQKNNNRELETKRLEGDIKGSYRKLILKLHPDRQQQFPESFKELSTEYFNEVQRVYDLLTNKEKHKNPDPHEGQHNHPGYIFTTLETFTLTSYVLSLQLNQPDEHPIVSTIKKFILARDDLEQMFAARNVDMKRIIEEKDKQRQISDGYRAQLQQAIEERHRREDLLAEIDTQLEKILN